MLRKNKIHMKIAWHSKYSRLRINFWNLNLKVQKQNRKPKDQKLDEPNGILDMP